MRAVRFAKSFLIAAAVLLSFSSAPAQSVNEALCEYSGTTLNIACSSLPRSRSSRTASISPMASFGSSMQTQCEDVPFAYLGKQSRVADIADDQIMRDRTILAKVQCEILQPRLGKIQERQMVNEEMRK
jgi:hypothetical protein